MRSSVVIRATTSAARGARFAVFPRRALQRSTSGCVLCQNWKRAWAARSRPVSGKARDGKNVGRARGLSSFSSGETRRAGWVYPPGVLQTKRTKAQFWARLRARSSREEPAGAYGYARNVMYTRTRVQVRTCTGAYACLPPSMKYFHWFHGQQTRLHDANNTLHGAAVPFTSLPRGRADRARKIQGEGETRGREWEKERELDPRDSPSSCPPRDCIVDARSTNFAKRHRSPSRVLTAGILKVCFRATRWFRDRPNAHTRTDQVASPLFRKKGRKKYVGRHGFFV